VVTGIKFIALGGGTMAAGRLEPGGTINGTVASFERLGDQVAQIASRVLDIVDRLDKEVFTEDKNKKLGKLVDDIASLASTLRATIDPLREEETGKDLTRLVSDVRRAANNIDGLVTDLRKSQSTVLSDATDALRGIQDVAGETNALIRSVRGELAGTGTSLGALISDLTEATNRLEETLTVIQADPSLLLRGRPKRLEDRP
jgi:ABC-type transporter Mla subunit MlaD